MYLRKYIDAHVGFIPILSADESDKNNISAQHFETSSYLLTFSNSIGIAEYGEEKSLWNAASLEETVNSIKVELVSQKPQSLQKKSKDIAKFLYISFLISLMLFLLLMSALLLATTPVDGVSKVSLNRNRRNTQYRRSKGIYHLSSIPLFIPSLNL